MADPKPELRSPDSQSSSLNPTPSFLSDVVYYSLDAVASINFHLKKTEWLAHNAGVEDLVQKYVHFICAVQVHSYIYKLNI